MAKGKKTGGRDFQPGHKVRGKRLPTALTHARKMSQAEFLSILVRFLDMTAWELEEILQDKNRTVMELWVARICATGIKDGDYSRLNFIAERLFGKVKNDQPQIHVNFAGLPREQIIELGQEAIRVLEAEKE